MQRAWLDNYRWTEMKNNKFFHSCIAILISFTVLSLLLTKPNHPISSSNSLSLYHAVDFSGIENPSLWRNIAPDVLDHSLYNLSHAQLQNFFVYKEKQYKDRANQIFQFCPLISDAANHPSQKSMLCRQDTEQRCLMVNDQKDKKWGKQGRFLCRRVQSLSPPSDWPFCFWLTIVLCNKSYPAYMCDLFAFFTFWFLNKLSSVFSFWPIQRNGNNRIQ